MDLVLTADHANWRRPEPLRYRLKCMMYLEADVRYLVEPDRTIDLLAFSRLCDPPASSECLTVGINYYQDGTSGSISSEFENPRFIRWDVENCYFRGPSGKLELMPKQLYFPQRDLRDSGERVVREIRELESLFGTRLVSPELDALNGLPPYEHAPGPDPGDVSATGF